MKFDKYQACGNDFIIIDTSTNRGVSPERVKSFAGLLCDRHFGIGADDVICLESSPDSDIRMRIFESQGPEADMCGNGIRCAASYLCEKLNRDEVTIETNDGIKHIQKVGERYRVNMGKLRVKMEDLRNYFISTFPDSETLLDRYVFFPEMGETRVSLVNSSEPHCVIFVDDVESENIDRYGKNITENKVLFPYGINVDLVELIEGRSLKIRTYERGVFYETLACGTGATASAGVAHVLGKVKNDLIEVITRGGKIEIEVTENGLYMTGPAVRAFDGVIELSGLSSI